MALIMLIAFALGLMILYAALKIHLIAMTVLFESIEGVEPAMAFSSFLKRFFSFALFLSVVFSCGIVTLVEMLMIVIRANKKVV